MDIIAIMLIYNNSNENLLQEVYHNREKVVKIIRRHIYAVGRIAKNAYEKCLCFLSLLYFLNSYRVKVLCKENLEDYNKFTNSLNKHINILLTLSEDYPRLCNNDVIDLIFSINKVYELNIDLSHIDKK